MGCSTGGPLRAATAANTCGGGTTLSDCFGAAFGFSATASSGHSHDASLHDVSDITINELGFLKNNARKNIFINFKTPLTDLSGKIKSFLIE